MGAGTEAECGSCGSVYWLRTDIQDCDCPYCRIADLEREVERLRQDKRRLDFWIEYRNDGRLEQLINGSWWFHVGSITRGGVETARQAIDAAMEGE